MREGRFASLNSTEGWNLTFQFRFKRKIRLYGGATFLSPVTYGIMHPKIVLPEDLEDISRVDMRNMIAHELVHIQRCDVAKRFLMLAALCIHWFNPLIWAMYHCYLEDQEMACDERVLRDRQGQEAKNYVYTMIKMASGGKMLWSTTGFAGKNAERKRILAAMNQKRMEKRNILAAAVLGLCLMSSFFSFTQAKEVLDTEPSDVQEAIGSLQLEGSEAVSKEHTLLAPFYEGEIRTPDDENFDYKAVLQDITDNYNDFSQPLTEEQRRALEIQDYIRMAYIYKERRDRGEKLKGEELWVIDEYYNYEEGYTGPSNEL